MEKTRFWLVLATISCLSYTKLSAQIHYITDNHRQYRDTVKQFGRGDTLAIGYDSVYVLNQTQMHYYKLLMNLKMNVSKDNSNLETLFKTLLQSLTKDLAELGTLANDLKTNAEATSVVGEQLAKATLTNVNKANEALEAAKMRLDSAQLKLNKADLHLAEAEKLIAKDKKLRWWRNVKWAGLGVVVGFVVKSVFF